MAYNPIDDNAEYNANQAEPALHSAVCKRVKNNAADTQSKRLLRRGTSFHPGLTSATTPNFVESDLLGYFDTTLGIDNTETISFQISTHPSKPMVMPLGWFDSAGCGKIKIRICMKVENAPMEMMAFALDPRDAAYPIGPERSFDTVSFGRVGGGFPGLGTSGFATSVTSLGAPTYFSVPTAAVGPNTDGFQFFEFEFDLNKPGASLSGVGSSFTEPRNDTLKLEQGTPADKASVDDVLGSVFVCIAFCSTADATLPTAVNLKASKYSNKAISYNTTFPTLAPFGPGKLHALLEVPSGVQTLDGTFTSTYHHCIMVRPDNQLAPNYGNTDAEILIYPQIPASADPATLTAGATHFLYPLSKATIYSVSVEEVLD